MPPLFVRRWMKRRTTINTGCSCSGQSKRAQTSARVSLCIPDGTRPRTVSISSSSSVHVYPSSVHASYTEWPAFRYLTANRTPVHGDSLRGATLTVVDGLRCTLFQPPHTFVAVYTITPVAVNAASVLRSTRSMRCGGGVRSHVALLLVVD